MKKNMFLRVASVLLVLTLLSTCAISGTFAKYVTTGSADDTARVAKWGVTITGTSGTANNMFLAAYDGTVESADSADVVAPGTAGTFSSFAVTGTPEVNVKVTYEATVDISDNWHAADGTTFYCPVVISVNGTAVAGSASTALEYEEQVKAAIDALTVEYDAGTDLSTVNDDLSITWAWAYENGKDADDTYLGDLTTAPTISISVKATITQVN